MTLTLFKMVVRLLKETCMSRWTHHKLWIHWILMLDFGRMDLFDEVGRTQGRRKFWEVRKSTPREPMEMEGEQNRTGRRRIIRKGPPPCSACPDSSLNAACCLSLMSSRPCAAMRSLGRCWEGGQWGLSGGWSRKFPSSFLRVNFLGWELKPTRNKEERSQFPPCPNPFGFSPSGTVNLAKYFPVVGVAAVPHMVHRMTGRAASIFSTFTRMQRSPRVPLSSLPSLFLFPFSLVLPDFLFDIFSYHVCIVRSVVYLQSEKRP